MRFSSRRYHRYHSHISHSHNRPRKIHPAVIVAIAVAVAVAAALIVGNLLRRWLDDETYDRLTVGREKQAEETPVDLAAPAVRAYPFTFRDSPSKLLNAETGEYTAAISVSLNDPDGSLLYHSAVADYLGVGTSSAPSLEQFSLDLLGYQVYLSGVFYPQALSQETTDLQYAATVRETALLREFLNTGGSEVMLVGLPTDTDRLTGTLTYLRRLRSMLGDNAQIGIAVPLSIAESEHGWEIIGLIKKTGCYCAIDLRDVPEEQAESAVLDANYYMSGYGMRLLAGSDQTGIYEIADAVIRNFQIVTKPAGGGAG